MWKNSIVYFKNIDKRKNMRFEYKLRISFTSMIQKKERRETLGMLELSVTHIDSESHKQWPILIFN